MFCPSLKTTSRSSTPQSHSANHSQSNLINTTTTPSLMTSQTSSAETPSRPYSPEKTPPPINIPTQKPPSIPSFPTPPQPYASSQPPALQPTNSDPIPGTTRDALPSPTEESDVVGSLPSSDMPRRASHKRSQTAPSTSRMKTLYCIRHAESEYNLRVRSFSTWVDPSFWRNGFDPLVRDPNITPTGRTQVSTLAQRLDSQDFFQREHIDMIVVSPLRRTLQTCMGVFDSSFEKRRTSGLPPIPILALPILREWMDTSGDLGRERKELEPEFPEVDFSLVPERGVWWYPPQSPHSDDVVKETQEDVRGRTREFLDWVSMRPERNVVVVGHSRFLRLLVNARKKLPNCGMMKVILDGNKVISWNPIR